MNANELYEMAEEFHIEIDSFPLRANTSISEMASDLSCHIAIDYSKIHTQAEESVVLAHEIGHCETGSFYNRYSPYDVRAKHEYRANKYAVLKLMPPEKVTEALKYGCRDVCEMAEYLDVTEDFVRTAIDIYKRVSGM